MRPIHLEGELSAFSTFEVLEFLAYLRRTGTLTLTTPDGLCGSVALADGQIVAAEVAHRRGEEAALTQVSWREGSFQFALGLTATEESTPIPVNAVVMEATRLDDELVRRSSFLPSPDLPLVLRHESQCPDPVSCGLQSVIHHIKTHPGSTLASLEEDSALCPAKVRLAVAQLAYCRLIDRPDVEASSPEPRQEGGAAASHAACVRVLIALEATDMARLLPRMLASLAADLGAPSITPMASQESPAFVRFRPEGRGVVSLTFLPVCREHRLLFESFGRSVDFVLLHSEAGPEAKSWQDEAGDNSALVAVRTIDALEIELKAFLAPWISA